MRCFTAEVTERWELSIMSGGGINFTVAGLHSFIKCLTILPIPLLISLRHLSPPTHSLAAESTPTHSIYVACVGLVCLCKYVYSGSILCPQQLTYEAGLSISVVFNIIKHQPSLTKTKLPFWLLWQCQCSISSCSISGRKWIYNITNNCQFKYVNTIE